MIKKGRHDPYVVSRAVYVIEALTALVLADFYLLNKTRKVKLLSSFLYYNILDIASTNKCLY
jgi:chorismate synthase